MNGRDTSKPLAGRARTLAETKRGVLHELYTLDQRAAPWVGTAYGVLQAVNTYEQHAATVRGTTRGERNQLRAITGDFARLDRSTRNALTQVLQAA